MTGPSGSRWDRARRSRVGRWAALVVLCYVVALLVVNLKYTAAGPAVSLIFPRIGSGNSLDDTSLAAEWNLIQNNYVFRDVGGHVGTQGSEQGIIDALDQQFHDRFTEYLTSTEYDELRSTLSGKRGGSVGIALEGRCAGGVPCPSGTAATEMVVEDVLVNQPAARAGLRPGDVLVAVGETQFSSGANIDSQLAQASKLIRGTAGTPVDVTVVRGTARLAFHLERANLQLPSVFSRRFGRVLYLQVTGFDDGTGDSARDMLRAAIAGGATAVILDLRQNGGGFVSEAQRLASQFLSPGGREQDVVVRRGRLSPSGTPTTAQTVMHDRIEPGGVATTQPVVVLVDQGTASAAEIVTAALADYHRATVLGVKTFGKGSVQLDYPLPDGSDLHLTVERWYGPDGTSIDGAGIPPGRTVQLPAADLRFRLDAISVDATQDAQMSAALDLLGV